MCRVDYCDGRSYEVATPEDAKLTHCTDCGRSVAGESSEITSWISSEDVPHSLYAWNVTQSRWCEYGDSGRDKLVWVNIKYEVLNKLNLTMEPYSLWDYVDENEDVPPEMMKHFHVQTTIACAQCLAARQWLLQVCNGWCFNEVREEIIEHWTEDEVYKTLDFGKLVVWCKAPHWLRNGRRIDPGALSELVSAAIPR